jgi:hypothetical protein
MTGIRPFATYLHRRAALARRFRGGAALAQPFHQIGYVTNGVAAASAEGFRVERIRTSPNAVFNIALAAWKLVPPGPTPRRSGLRRAPRPVGGLATPRRA